MNFPKTPVHEAGGPPKDLTAEAAALSGENDEIHGDEEEVEVEPQDEEEEDDEEELDEDGTAEVDEDGTAEVDKVGGARVGLGGGVCVQPWILSGCGEGFTQAQTTWVRTAVHRSPHAQWTLLL